MSLRGLEPPLPFGNRLLRAVRLPISPQARQINNHNPIVILSPKYPGKDSNLHNPLKRFTPVLGVAMPVSAPEQITTNAHEWIRTTNYVDLNHIPLPIGVHELNYQTCVDFSMTIRTNQVTFI